MSDSVASKLGLALGRSFTKHRVEAYIHSTVYVDIISCWSLLYGVYDGGKYKHVCTINIDFLNSNDICLIKFYRTFYNCVWTGYLTAERSELFGIKT